MALLENMGSALETIGTHIKVLPAVGGAVEYLQRPDADEIDDVLVPRIGKVHFYSYDAIPVPLELIRRGPNEFHVYARTEHHAAEMCRMGDVATAGLQEREQRKDHITGDEPLCFDRQQTEEIDDLVWKEHAEGQQYTADRAGGSDDH